MVHVPPPPAPAAALAFTPAAPRPRRDGWTADRQTAFIAALAAGDSVTAACRRVGRSPKSAYALRARPDAVSFAAAWDATIADIEVFATSAALDRCLEGTRKPVIYQGRIIGERVVHNDRMLMHLLRRARPTFAPADSAAAFERDLKAITSNNFDAADERL